MSIVKYWTLGRISYDTGYKLQLALARRHAERAPDADTVLFLEHKPVYTVGIRDVITPEETRRLKALGAEYRRAGRGGQATFHGPGQLLAYPALSLRARGLGVRAYVHALEEIVIRMCRELGLNSYRCEHIGVWAGERKLCAVGVGVSRGVTRHGLALNCDVDARWFQHVLPCGLPPDKVTTLSQELNRAFTVVEALPLLMRNFEEVFGCRLEPIDQGVAKRLLDEALQDILSETSGRQSL